MSFLWWIGFGVLFEFALGVCVGKHLKARGRDYEQASQEFRSTLPG